MISIEGTTLYSKYKRKMLVAVGVDVNNQLIPLAFVIVEDENNGSWAWFMAWIRVRVMQPPDLCVISDRHRGILAVMKDDYLGCVPRCAYHHFCI